MFETVLVANRGEIAVRVLRSAAELGYRTVAVYSDVDAGAPHVQRADEAVCLGPASPAESYLNAAKILEAAALTGADAIHPGYGFLSENAAFARAVMDTGLVWIGPPPDSIEAMGDKAQSKARMRAAGVPCVPGFDAEDPSDATLIAQARTVGFPLLVKASAGGGGRGMRRVANAEQLPAALLSARAEAEGAFGSGHLLLERLVEHARHVEIQVFADTHGAVVHLGERDCSVQRRHQKVIEEAPSPAMTPELRQAMGEAACRAAEAVGYVGAGTVEFLLDADGAFYFLEMNTRLQVEHPVTEAVTGLDLVALQLRVAAGLPLGFSQDEVQLQGHAIELRLYAEDPAVGFLPQPGPVYCWQPPPSIRVDHGLQTSGEIPSDYDPMVAKLIAHGPDRATALRRLRRALDRTVFFGVQTNRDLLAGVLDHPDFRAGQATTAFLGTYPELVEPSEPDPRLPAILGAVWASEMICGDSFRTSHPLAAPLSLSVDGTRLDLHWSPGRVDDQPAQVEGTGLHRHVRLGSHRIPVQVFRRGSSVWVRALGRTQQLQVWDELAGAVDGGVSDTVRMPMAGKIVSIEVAVGDAVSVGTVVARVEAMKLETSLKSEVAGTVAEIRGAPGESAASGALLVRIEPSESSAL